MSLESATKVSELVATNPTGSDPKSQGDDHLRMIKLVLQNNAIKSEIGQSATPANNFSLDASADNGTMKLERGNGDEIITVGANDVVNFPPNRHTVRAGVSNTSIANAVTTTVVFSQEYQDDNAEWNGSVFQPKVAGIYFISAAIAYTSGGTGERGISVRLNGNAHSVVSMSPPTTLSQLQVTALVPMNGTTDQIVIGAYQDSGAAIALNNGQTTNRFNAFLIQGM
jgi:hypothetical protein